MTEFAVPFAERRWDEIVPGLFQGGHDYQPSLAEPVQDVIVADEFDLVVSLYRRRGADHGPLEGVEHIASPVLDHGFDVADLPAMRDLADRVAYDLRAHRRVLVRCQAGYNRSGLVVALTLLRLGYSAAGAIDLIRARRSPHALCNDRFVRYIHGEEQANTARTADHREDQEA